MSGKSRRGRRPDDKNDRIDLWITKQRTIVKPPPTPLRPQPAPLKYLDSLEIDALLGKKRPALQIGTSLWTWPLWQKFKPYDARLLTWGTATTTGG